MLKIVILTVALLWLASAQSTPASVNDQKPEVPNLNETDLQKSIAARSAAQTFTLGNKVYLVNPTIRVNWITAQQICSYEGMTLASINSADEGEQLQRYLTKIGLTSHREEYWISGTDLGTKNQWVWLSNGFPFRYTNWRRGEPNNYGGSERCVEVFWDGLWNDLYCETLNYFICENRCSLGCY